MEDIRITHQLVDHPTVKGFREDCLVALYTQGAEIWKTGIYKLSMSGSVRPPDWAL